MFVIPLLSGEKIILHNKSMKSKPRPFIFILLFLSFSFLFFQCTQKDKTSHKQALWSCQDPLSIPLHVRKNQFMKGNLALNHSFESGKYFYEDSLDQPFFVKNWSKIGDHVEWVDLDRIDYDKSEVSEGKHAIKIHRLHSDETDDMGEGAISDFIKVIPGNYIFTYYTKLENISPNKTRLGTKLYDAIDIRILFFDKNKIQIDARQFYPYIDGYLDNSFKGYSYSNFWHIEKFGWGRVIGRTYNYPFSEGDIPDDTRYVKLFFGLKGTGTMWVDNVDFRFSRWNFTTLERLEPYFDSTFKKIDLLIPTPKRITEGKILTYFHADSTNIFKPLILIPSSAQKETITASHLLKDRLESRINKLRQNSTKMPVQVNILHNLPQNLSKNTLIFSIGKTALFEKNVEKTLFDEIKDKNQGYIIETSEDNIPVVFLAGNRPIGDYYAVTTAIRLLDEKNYLFHSATIVDYPDIQGRSYLFASWQNEEEMNEDIQNIRRMSILKFNKAYVGYGQTRGRKNWYSPDQLYYSGIENAGKICSKIGVIDLATMINPYYHFEYEMHTDSLTKDLRYQWTHSDPKSLDMLKNVFQISLDAGAKTIMLMADDFVPHENDYRKLYSLYTEEDKKKFVNLQNAHAFLINNLYHWLNRYYPGTRFEFCPPWYLNEFIDKSRGRAEQYFRDLIPQIPDDIAIIWTGPTVRSLSYDDIDFFRYENLIKRKPMIWDNTLYARGLTGKYGGYPAMYPGKVRMCNIFEPYDVLVPKDFYKYIDGPHMYINGAALSETYKIKYSTVADFEWNNNAYNPDLSLWKTLVSDFGKEPAIHLLQFNDAYYGLTDVCMKIDRGGNLNKLLKQGESHSEKLHLLYSKLCGELKNNPKLVKEITGKKEEIINRYQNLL